MASRGINKVILVGNLGQEPDIRYMPSGGAVATLSLATSESWRDKQTGELRENVEWHRVVVFGKLAEIAGEYLHKGSQVYIEGQLRIRKWQGQDGTDRYTTEVVVSANGSMQMLGSRQGNPSAAPQYSGQPQNTPPQQQNAPAAPAKTSAKGGKGKGAKKAAATAAAADPMPPQIPQGGNEAYDFDDDIPF